MPAYEILLHKADGALSIVMFATATSNADAITQASRMLKRDLAYAQIWNDTTEIGTIHRSKVEQAPDADQRSADDTPPVAVYGPR